MSKPPPNILRRNRQQGLFERLNQIRECSRLEATQDRLNFRPRQFNRIEVGRVRRQIDQVCATRLDQRLDAGNLVGREIVHEQDFPGLEGRDDTLLNVTIKDVAIDCTRQDQGRCDTRQADYRPGRGLRPRRLRRTVHHPLIGWRTPVQPSQAQIYARFVEKFESLNFQRRDFFLKPGTLPLHARGVTLAGVKRLFFSGNFSRANSRHIMLGSDLILLSCSTRPHKSCKVASGCSFTAARISLWAAANLRGTPPAWGSGAQLSVARFRANQRSTDGSLILYRLAASGILHSPLSTLNTTRSRRSVE